mmetsp:Transcript_5017/g.12709  ORF Transcript_5017/g.12709 Transcript_5017/m.12709 type:complete len:342 (-) Transcript_5017:360-1385(-)
MKNSSPSLLQPGSISLVSDSVDGDDNDQNNNSNRNNNNNTTRNKSDNEDTNAEAMLDNILEAPPLPSSNVAAAATTTTRTGTAKTGESPAATKKSTSVFDRLYSSHTAASKSHSSGAPSAKGTTTPNSNTKMKRSYARPSPKAQHLTPTKLNYAAGTGAQSSPSSSSPTSSSFRRTPVKDRGIKSPAAVPKSATGRKHSMEYSIRMKPLTKLYFISKFHPGVGLEPIEPIKLGYTFFQSFCDYENGAMAEEQISKEIIVAFFKQDFPSGRHWQMNEPTTSLVPSKSSSTSSSTDMSSYLVSMSATYDWEDAYRVATARGVVHFKNKEIRVENYAYDLTGDP